MSATPIADPSNVAARPGSGPPRSATAFALNLVAVVASVAITLLLLNYGKRLDGMLSLPSLGAVAVGGNYRLIATVGCLSVFAIIGIGEWLWRRRQPRVESVLPWLRPVDAQRVGVRLLGFAATLALIAFAYWLFPEYHGTFYRPFWDFLRTLAIPLAVLVIPYFVWMDQRLAEPRDEYWRMGMLALGRGWSVDTFKAQRAHFMAWTVKAFFLPLMVVYLDNQLRSLDRALGNLSGSNGMSIYQFLYEASYTVDLMFCVVGYTITLRLFRSQVRSTEPTAFGWLVALVCYQPFYSIVGSMYIKYDDNLYWDNWLAQWPTLRGVWAGVIILLLVIYSLSTASFGLRFSNLTYRGVITNGPYRYTKHPAYLSKNLSWWLISVPWLSNQSWHEAVRNCCMLALLNGIYFLRARTEERHLSLRDAEYVAYALWINEHGLLARLGKWVPGLRYRGPKA